MNKPTPGPWHTAPDKSFYVFAHGSLSEQAGVTDGPFICSASSQANARLIAAAPDLLAAARCALADLQGLIVDLYDEHPAHQTEAELRAAIARAEGEAV
jgi:hypothetical protein